MRLRETVIGIRDEINMGKSGSFSDMSARHHRFDALVGVFHADMFRYAYWLCGNRDLAQDLVQDTMLRAWRALDSLREEAAAKQWLITILRRELARHYERAKPPGIELEKVPLEATGPGPEDDAETRILRRNISELDADYREPLVMQVLLGFSVADIADVLEMKEATVLTRLYRARRKLAASMTEGAVGSAGAQGKQ